MMNPGESTYSAARRQFKRSRWGSFNLYCKSHGKTIQWGRDCLLFGEGRGNAAGEFFKQALEDCGLLEQTQTEDNGNDA